MSCERYIILLDEYVNGELDETTCGLVAAHLSVCRDCREELGFLQIEANVYGQAAQFRERKFADQWEKSSQRLFANALLETKQTENLQTAVSAGSLLFADGFFSGFRKLFLTAKPVFGVFLLLFIGISAIILLKDGNDPINEKIVAKTPQQSVVENEKSPETPLEFKSPETVIQPPIADLPTESKKNAVAVKTVAVNKNADKRLAEKAFFRIAPNRPTEKVKTETSETPVEIANNLETETGDRKLNNHLNKVHLFLLMFRNLKKDETINAVIGGKYQNEAQMILENNSNYKNEMLKNRHIPEAELLSEIEPVLTAIAKLDAQGEKNNFDNITAMMKQSGIVFKMRLRMAGNKSE
ncbi:MAG: zf-HC2 domain-containing protein [Pyrinomonadaceae bacterium]|nr:zf-HC2 domain-containing protein [Pyrinomonadaceae bacterium]